MADYCKILIIDDEFIMRQGLKHMINWEEEGFEIVGEASNGQDGLQLIQQLHPNLIICDIVMPIMDGMDFANMVQQLHPDIPLIILSGYDNFEYVKSTLLSGAVDYILKPTLNPDELLHVLKNAVRKIPGFSLCDRQPASLEKVMERYLLGFEEHLDVSQFHNYFSNTYYRIMAFRSSPVLMEQARKLVKKTRHRCGLLISLADDTACLILNYSASEEDAMMREINLVTQTMRMINPGFFAVCSSQLTQIQGLYKYYQTEIAPFTMQRFYYQNVHLKVLKKNEHHELLKCDRFDYNRYSGLLLRKHFDDARNMLDHYIQEAVKCRMDEYRLKNQTKNMIYNYLEYIDDSKNPGEELRYRFFQKIDDAMYAEEFMKAFADILIQLQELTGSGCTPGDGTIIQILRYVSENYKLDLDLAQIASVFNFNYYYLSAYFKQHMKEGFSDYLNRIRIEEAARLLRENKLPISQVSGAVGYSDHSYFCRVFKKITGETPSAWRREHHE